ncbi:MAG: recombinase zinc beta ribbon domain-containing protein, partial [Streptosporangiaceae bacterium]
DRTPSPSHRPRPCGEAILSTAGQDPAVGRQRRPRAGQGHRAAPAGTGGGPPACRRPRPSQAPNPGQLAELDHRGRRNRGRRDRPVGPIGVSALANILSNKAYAGIVSWEGIDYPGLHQPLTDTATFNKVQDLLAARAARGTRERRHNHYLKGTLFCGVCGRGLSFQLAKGRYEYLYCLGQKNRNPTGCQEPYMAAGDLEAQVEQLYEKIQLPKSWLNRLREELEAEIAARQHRNAAEREFLTRKLAKADTERRKLLDAYYAGAIDVTTLKTEQARIAADVRSAEERLAAVDAHLAEWQEILETAMRFATNCAKAYARASAPTGAGSTKPCSPASRCATARSPPWDTTRRSTCSFLRASSNTAIWWS